jgi:very-short-patch-repair endonuclease
VKPNTAPPRKFRGTTRALVESARLLRRDLTPAERVLWAALQGRQLAGLRFRSQHAIGPFVADFFCPAARLILEVDGPIHDQQTEQDAYRTDYLSFLGYRVLRFRNEEVMHNLPTILARIEHAALTVPPEQRLRKALPQPTHSPEAPETPQSYSPPPQWGI